ncbi:MAG: nucleotidyltransferase domain-containing protein [Anaerolineales bacterium]|nr:nucleotidyltransferase domain-containing protein [Anaerolineales bacterium]
MSVTLATREVRLDREEMSKLSLVFDTTIAQYPGALVYLFGSRTNPTLRGGDIDLLVVFRDAIENSYEIRKKLRMAITEQLGDQKVDCGPAKSNNFKN